MKIRKKYDVIMPSCNIEISAFPLKVSRISAQKSLLKELSRDACYKKLKWSKALQYRDTLEKETKVFPLSLDLTWITVIFQVPIKKTFESIYFCDLWFRRVFCEFIFTRKKFQGNAYRINLVPKEAKVQRSRQTIADEIGIHFYCEGVSI